MHGTGITEHELLARQRLERTAHDAAHSPRLPYPSRSLRRHAAASLRRIAQSVGLGRRASPISIAWRESPSAGGIATRSVVLDLSLIPRGKYVLKLEAAPRGQGGATSSRVLDIR